MTRELIEQFAQVVQWDDFAESAGYWIVIDGELIIADEPEFLFPANSNLARAA